MSDNTRGACQAVRLAFSLKDKNIARQLGVDLYDGTRSANWAC